MTKQQTQERLAGKAKSGPHDRVLTVFEEHYRLAGKTMKAEAALATAYGAAQNYLASIKVNVHSGLNVPVPGSPPDPRAPHSNNPEVMREFAERQRQRGQ